MSITGTTCFATQFKKYPNVDLGYRINFFGASSQSIYYSNTYCKTELLFPKRFKCHWDYAFNRFKNESTGIANNFKIS
jgi:hypothetical protein